jgi:hypothetical protein
MSKRKASQTLTHHEVWENPWDIAIKDTEEVIMELKGRIARLNHAVQGFRQLKDAGQPFPSAQAKTERLKPH